MISVVPPRIRSYITVLTKEIIKLYTIHKIRKLSSQRLLITRELLKVSSSERPKLCKSNHLQHGISLRQYTDI